jgi:ferredoxin-NADP reductase
MAPLVYDFIFTTDSNLKFEAGQYLEWTLPIFKTDGRGNRRYFTIASSPTEKEIHLGVKIPSVPSVFKKGLLDMKPGDTMLAGQLAGDFTLPHNTNRPIVCIAGGIGITPFRSMIKNIIDSGTKRDLTLLYASSDVSEFVYRDVFDAAESLGVKTAYILSGAKEVPSSWQGPVGYITADMVKQNVSNYDKALYYISGPNIMVENYKKMLTGMGISRLNIVTDYFPGY